MGLNLIRDNSELTAYLHSPAEAESRIVEFKLLVNKAIAHQYTTGYNIRLGEYHGRV